MSKVKVAVIIFRDFISHGAMTNIRKQARSKGMTVKCCRRTTIGLF